MKAFQYTEFSDDWSKAKLTDVEKPKIKPGHALIKIKAAAGNPVDNMVMTHIVPWETPFPFTVGYDFSGTIEAVDGPSDDFAVGDDVFSVNFGKGDSHVDGEDCPVGGAMAEYISYPLAKLSKKPEEVPHTQAAGIALVGTTAYQGLFAKGGLQKGERVLVLGGAGAVGAIAIQLAKNAGAWVATTHSTRSKAYVESFGAADQLINYNEKKWEDELKDIDVVFDTVGEANGLERAKRVLKEKGAFVTIANPEAGFDPQGHPPLRFASWFLLSNSPENQDELVSQLAGGKLKVNIEATYPFTDEGLQNMYKAIMSGKSQGKHVVQM